MSTACTRLWEATRVCWKPRVTEKLAVVTAVNRVWELQSGIETEVEDMLSDQGEIFEEGPLSTYPILIVFYTALVELHVHPWSSERWPEKVSRTWR